MLFLHGMFNNMEEFTSIPHVLALNDVFKCIYKKYMNTVANKNQRKKIMENKFILSLLSISL